MTTCIFSWDKKLQFTHSRYFSHNVLNVINSEFKLSPLSIPLLPLFFSSPGQSALGEGRLSSWFFIRSLEGSRRAGRGGDLGSLLTSASSTWSMDLLCCPVLSISRISAGSWSECEPPYSTLCPPHLPLFSPAFSKLLCLSVGRGAGGRAWGSFRILFCFPSPKRASTRLPSGPLGEILPSTTLLAMFSYSKPLEPSRAVPWLSFSLSSAS